MRKMAKNLLQNFCGCISF